MQSCHTNSGFPRPSTTTARTWGGALLVFALALAYLFPFRLILLWFGDEGYVAGGAERILQGAVPYRDFFEFVAPGTMYLYAAAFWLLGLDVGVLRAVATVVGALIAALLYLLGSSLQRRWMAWLPPALFVVAYPLWFVASHHWVSTLCTAAALLPLASDRLPPHAARWRWTAAGVGAALTLLTLQDKGVYLAALLGLAALLEGIWVRRLSGGRFNTASLLGFTIGMTAVLAPVTLFFALQGALGALLYACFIWPLEHYHRTVSLVYFGEARDYLGQMAAATSHRELLRPLLRLLYGGSLAILPPIALAGGAFLLIQAWRGRRPWVTQRPLAILLAGGAALFLSACHFPEVVHFATACGPLWVLLAMVADRSAAGPRLTAWAAWSLAALLILPSLAHASRQWRWALNSQRYTIHTPRGDFRTESPEFQAYVHRVLSHVEAHSRPGAPIFCFSWSPLYYFITGRYNPTHYQTLQPEQASSRQFNHAIADLQRNPARVVIWEHFPESGYPSHLDRSDFDRLGRFLRENYTVIDELQCPPPGFVAATTILVLRPDVRQP